jgi:hypothetical protein
MAPDPTSRKPAQPPQPTTLRMCASRSSAMRVWTSGAQEAVLALRTVGKALGRPLPEIPADPAHLQRQLEDHCGHGRGCAGPLAQCVQLQPLGFGKPALPASPAGMDVPMSSEWAELMKEAKDQRTRYGLSRLARYWSINGISPTRSATW